MNNEFETRWGYLLEMLWMSLLIFFNFRHVVFRRLPGVEHETSMRIAFLLMVAGMCLTFLLCRNRTVESALFASCVPLGLYTYAALFAYYKTVLVITALVAVAAAGAFAIWVLTSPVSVRQRRPVIMKRRRRNCAAVACMSLTLCAMVALGCGTFATLHGGLPLKQETSDQWTVPEGVTLEENLEALVNLEESRWATLTAEQRLELLQILAKSEQAYLGLSDEIKLYTDALPKNVLGRMNYRTGWITIDLEHLRTADSHDVVDTVLHECRHVYTKALSELYENVSPEHQQLRLFMGVDQYVSEYQNYINGSSAESVEDYYWQNVEIDAREYAAYRTDMVFHRIEKYLKEMESHE